MEVCRPLAILKKLKIDFSDLKLSELELDTYLHDHPEWSAEHECVASILTCIRNPEAVMTDPILFSQVSLGLLGLSPDFEEFEFIDPEIMNITFAFFEKMQLYHTIKFPEPSDDLKGYVASVCAEDGLFFVKNNLEKFQEEILIVFKESLNSDVPVKDMEECQKLWEEYKDKKLEDIPETNNNFFQIKANFFIREYTKEILS